MTTLIVAAHMDDEALSAGGLILKRVQQGKKVWVMVPYGRAYAYKQGEMPVLNVERENFEEACKLLGVAVNHCYLMPEGEPSQVGYYRVLKELETHWLKDEVTEVVIPSENDLNQDHRFLRDICNIALRPANLKNVQRILAWRSFDTNIVKPTYYVSLTKAEVDRKLNAISCYDREARTLPHPRAPENIVALHRVYGSYCGAEYAEGYDLVFSKE